MGSLEAESKGKMEALRQKKKLAAEIKEIQDQISDEQRLGAEFREQYGIAERRANALHQELEESRTLLESSDRGRRMAEADLGEAHENMNIISQQNGMLTVAKRKLEGDIQTMHDDLDEMLSEAKNSEEKAKKAMVDAARLADELRSEQEHASTQEKMKKALEGTYADVGGRLAEAEANANKLGRQTIGKLEGRVRELENQLDDEATRHTDAQKNLRKCERRIKELTFQAEEDKKNHGRMQDLTDKLHQKIKTYKRQIEEAEEIAALNLAKFRKSQQELESAEEQYQQMPRRAIKN